MVSFLMMVFLALLLVGARIQIHSFANTTPKCNG
jgi:hypothetical protein